MESMDTTTSMARPLAAALGLTAAAAFLPAQNPPWGPAEYNMSLSTITMACNQSGACWFGVVDEDQIGTLCSRLGCMAQPT